jgi:hypothetical protein
MSALRTTQISVTAALAATLVALAAAAPASASPAGVIRDCSEDGVLNGKYSQSELDGALEQLPSDLDEYTDCRAVIRRAQLGAAGDKHRRGRGTSAAERVDAAAPPSSEEQEAIAKAAGSDAPVRIGGEGVRPGEAAEPFDTAGFGGGLPVPVLVMLIALGLASASGTALAARRRWRGSLAGEGGPLRRIGREVRRGVSRFRR